MTIKTKLLLLVLGLKGIQGAGHQRLVPIYIYLESRRAGLSAFGYQSLESIRIGLEKSTLFSMPSYQSIELVAVRETASIAQVIEPSYQSLVPASLRFIVSMLQSVAPSYQGITVASINARVSTLQALTPSFEELLATLSRLGIPSLEAIESFESLDVISVRETVQGFVGIPPSYQSIESISVSMVKMVVVQMVEFGIEYSMNVPTTDLVISVEDISSIWLVELRGVSVTIPQVVKFDPIPSNGLIISYYDAETKRSVVDIFVEEV